MEKSKLKKITDKEMLNARDYIDYKDFFNEFDAVRNRNLNPYRRQQKE